MAETSFHPWRFRWRKAAGRNRAGCFARMSNYATRVTTLGLALQQTTPQSRHVVLKAARLVYPTSHEVEYSAGVFPIFPAPFPATFFVRSSPLPPPPRPLRTRGMSSEEQRAIIILRHPREQIRQSFATESRIRVYLIISANQVDG